MSEWPPIETAKKDGTADILSYANGVCRVVWWADIDQVWYSHGLLIFKPTHWMPLPPLPSNEKREP
jgi:hypothetical protein